ncbi:IclR family transcriptional regulator domain-containing protein [Massilia niastensis]|uniref:IclR family transcriptional regulator domain-containing protein n=1 Tax=Massilia niastensis TaxID=544911 RepID=UPI00039F0DF3|nr:IclR family transcriptional regulator C-terminal domain-containing protein [Massilia niastensis]
MKRSGQAPLASTELPRTAYRSVPAVVDVQSQLAAAIEHHSDDPDFVTALARGLGVMMALSEKRRPMSIAQVSHITGIPRAAARRSLHTLAKLGFAAMDDANLFYLRPRILSLSHSYLSASPLAMLSQPILDKLGEEIGESCSLAVLDSDEIVYLARSSGSRVISPSLNVGRRIPAYCTSIGRILLAHLPDPELEHYLENARLQAYTEHTVTDRTELRDILLEARANGYAYSREQIEMRVCSLAVPVRDTSGQYVAGISVLLQGRPISAQEAASKYFHPMNAAANDLGHLLMM